MPGSLDEPSFATDRKSSSAGSVRNRQAEANDHVVGYVSKQEIVKSTCMPANARRH